MNSGGDVLAKGGRSAIFGPPKVSEKRWNEIWAVAPPESEIKNKPLKIPAAHKEK